MDIPDYDAVAMLHGCTHKMRKNYWAAMSFWYGYPMRNVFQALCYTSNEEGFVRIEGLHPIVLYDGDGFVITPLT